MRVTGVFGGTLLTRSAGSFEVGWLGMIENLRVLTAYAVNTSFQLSEISDGVLTAVVVSLGFCKS